MVKAGGAVWYRPGVHARAPVPQVHTRRATAFAASCHTAARVLERLRRRSAIAVGGALDARQGPLVLFHGLASLCVVFGVVSGDVVDVSAVVVGHGGGLRVAPSPARVAGGGLLLLHGRREHVVSSAVLVIGVGQGGQHRVDDAEAREEQLLVGEIVDHGLERVRRAGRMQ